MCVDTSSRKITHSSHNLAYRIGRADDDLVQEALLRGLKAFRRSVQVEHPRAFFSKIVRDTVRDHWRHRHVLLSLESIAQEKLAHMLDFEQRLDRQNQLRQIRDAFSLLSPEQRELMELFYFEGFSIRQLSVMLSKSRSALKMALLRGRHKVIQAVTTDCVTQQFERKQ